MSLMSNLFGMAVKSLMGGKGGGVTAGSGGDQAMQLVMSLIQNQQGGLSGLLGNLTQGGLGEQVKSWISTGENQAVDTNQLSSSLGSNVIGMIAQKVGVSPEMASGLLAQALPQVVDKLSPNGQLDESNLQNGLSALMGMLGKK